MTGTSMSVASSIAIAQLNPHLGNITANVDRLLEARRGATGSGADIIVTPEMYLSGYPCVFSSPKTGFTLLIPLP